MPPSREAYFPQGAPKVLGIFGFLNPGLDYDMVFDLLKGLDADVCLLILGGPRIGGNESIDLESQAADRGLSGRVRVTGYLPEADLSAYLRLCDLFLCPMRFKSNSGSLLNLIHLGKPILTSDLPLTRYLKKEGAPIELYADSGELAEKVRDILKGSLRAQPNRYPWRFDAVADAYIKALETAVRS